MVNFAAKRFGGAILFADLHESTLIFLNQCVFVGCYSGASSAEDEGGVKSFGGAIAVVNAKVQITSTKFESSESDFGGAVSVTSHAFFQNALQNSRHLMENYPTELHISKNTTFYDNTARLSGGAVFAGEGSLRVDGDRNTRADARPMAPCAARSSSCNRTALQRSHHRASLASARSPSIVEGLGSQWLGLATAAETRRRSFSRVPWPI